VRHRLTYFFLLLSVLSGCSARLYPSRDTQRTERETVTVREHVLTVPVKVAVEIPSYREFRTDVKDSVSVIENQYAKSTVIIHKDGSYDHVLEGKAQRIDADTTAQVTVSDTLRQKETSEVSTITRTVETHTLLWWQKGLVWLGVIALAMIVLKIVLKLI